MTCSVAIFLLFSLLLMMVQRSLSMQRYADFTIIDDRKFRILWRKYCGDVAQMVQRSLSMQRYADRDRILWRKYCGDVAQMVQRSLSMQRYADRDTPHL